MEEAKKPTRVAKTVRNEIERTMYLAQVVYDTFEPANPTPRSTTTMVLVYAEKESEVEPQILLEYTQEAERTNLRVSIRACTVFRTIKN